MASKFFISLVLALLACVSRASEEEITCEKLDVSACAYAVSSSGLRCVLDEQTKTFTCHTSTIEAVGFKNWIESDACITSCGLNRHIVGVASTDLLADAKFVKMLCSIDCYTSCPNIVDLYYNLASNEGMYLPKLCESWNKDSRRDMEELENGGELFFTSTPLRVASPPAMPPV